MTRLLVVIFWCVVAYLLIQAWKRRSDKKEEPKQPIGNQAMVPCAHCGVYLPESEAVKDNGRIYCSSAHRHLGPGNHD